MERMPVEASKIQTEKGSNLLGELIMKDKDLRAEFFKLREKLEEEKISQEEKSGIKERLKEINAKCEPISKELDAKSKGFYSEIMDIVVKKKKGVSEKKWEDTAKKSGETLKEAEEKLRKMEDTDPNIKKYLEERIKQKREQLGITEAVSPEPTPKEETIEKPEKLEEPQPEELKTKKKISPEAKVIEKAKRGEPLSKKDMEVWQKIQSQQALEEMKSEIRELREKKQRGEVFSEEEKHRLEILKLKWDILQRSGEIKEEKTPIEREKTKEDLEKKLEAGRKAYAEAYKNYREAFGGMKEKDLKVYEKTVEHARKFIEPGDSEKLKSENQGAKENIEAELRKQNFISELEKGGLSFTKAKSIYETELKKAEYEAAKIEAGKKLSEQGVGKAEIFKKLILDERELLNQAKIESWPPKEKNIFRKGMEWWMKRGTATRLLISTGLVTGVVASVGGFGAAAVATYAGYRFVRGFGSVMIGKLAGKGVDIAMSRGIESKKEAAMEKLKTGFDLKKLTETSKELEKIFEETAKRERRKLLIKAAVSATAGAGAAIGMGMAEQAWAGGGVKVAPETLKSKTPTPETAMPKVENINIAEVAKGDSVWKLTEEQLELRGYFKDLTGSPEEILTKKNYLIDAIKDKIAESPEKFGIGSGNADLIKPGEKIDFSSIFQNQEDINSIMEKVGGLKTQEAENVLSSKEALETPPGVVEEKAPAEGTVVPETIAPKSGIKESWLEAGKKVEYTDQEVSKIPENYYTRPDEAAKIIAEQAIKDPVFFEKIGNIMGDSYFRYENFRNFKIGLLLDKQGPQWRAIEEHFGEIKGLKPEEYLAIDSGTKNLLERTNSVFENIGNPIEKDAARNLTLDQFLRKYFDKL